MITDQIPKPPAPPFPLSGLTRRPGNIPLGTVHPYACSIDPVTHERDSGNGNEPQNFGPGVNNNTGWILCDGSSVQIAVFPGLFNILGFLYGKGEGENTFRVPDYRGYFLRAVDPDGKIDKGLDQRSPYPAAGSVGTSQGVASIQDCMVQEHEHHYTNYSSQKPPQLGPGDSPTNGPDTQLFTGAEVYPPGSGPATQPWPGKETRPVNIYINYLVYAGLPWRVD